MRKYKSQDNGPNKEEWQKEIILVNSSKERHVNQINFQCVNRNGNQCWHKEAKIIEKRNY